MGAGVIGTTTAYYLAKSGAQVTVIDRQPDPAQETSFANAGQVSPGYSTPWAAPGIPLKALKWMLEKHAPLSIKPDGTLWQLRWMLSMLRECNSARYAINKERMMRLSEYSRDCLQALRDRTGLQYEHRTGGTLQLFRTQQQMDGVMRDIQVLEECGVPYELLGPSELAHAEPALALSAAKLTGGLRLPNDETGDCNLFTQRLADLACHEGVRFQFNQPVDHLEISNDRIMAIHCGQERLTADRYVVAFGSYSRNLLLPAGIELPVYPVKGYSLTVPLVDASRAPVSTVLDETYKIAVTRFDHRIRVGGMAELSGFDLSLNLKRRATLEMVVSDLFPGGDLARATFWTGLRPMTPDSTPIVGGTRLSNLFVNTGHGTLGWTMACGSGKLMSDIVLGVKPEIDVEGLDLSRYGQPVPTSRWSSKPVSEGATS